MATPIKRTRERARCSAEIRPPSTNYRQDHLTVLRQLVLGVHGVREGKMFGHPAFFVGRRMFACVYDDGVGLKLPAHRASALIEAGGAAPFQPYGKPKMREWVQITRAHSDDYAAERNILIEAISFAADDRSNRRAP